MVGISEIKRKGSAKSGSHHWWAQRISAVALVPLVIWLISGLIVNLSDKAGRYDSSLYAWIKEGAFSSVLMIMLITAAIYHGTLGIQVVIEDYVHKKCSRTFLIIFTRLFAILTLVAGVFGILRIHLL
jgi:succinate dehydrogenase / fumarate reductase, membrane anchor subunit